MQEQDGRNTPKLADLLPGGDVAAFCDAFDADFYLERYGDDLEPDTDPVLHYAAEGWREGRDPSPDFSTDFYLEDNPDVVAAGMNPFWHYCAVGRHEGRLPLPPAPERAALDPEQRAVVEGMEAYFDADFYLERYGDDLEPGTDPVVHYVAEGWREGRDPSPDFSTDFYLEDNPDVVAAGMNPFWHYCAVGRHEGRLPLPPAPDERAALDPEQRAVVMGMEAYFDADFYLERYGDDLEPGTDPVVHYAAEGWREGRDPSPDFSTDFYLEDNPDVVAAGMNPFWHYCAVGRHEGRMPLPPAPERVALDPEQRAVVEGMEAHFDAEFYLRVHPEIADAGRDALVHYALEGWREGRDPSPHFSTDFYLEDNPDVVDAGINPFWHFCAVGRHEGRMPLPPAPERVALDPEQRAVVEGMEAHFDAEFYLRIYPEIADAGRDALVHYALEGWREGRDPSPHFSTDFYLEDNPDVVDAGINPFWHYCAAGRHEGRVPLPPAPGNPVEVDPDTAADEERGPGHEIDGIREEFDADFYLQKYPDVAETDIDPLEHFVLYGWQEGRDPSAAFSTSYYCASNPDVADSGLNPFWHYCVIGRAEGRYPRHPGGKKAVQLFEQVPFEETVARWSVGRDVPETLMDAEEIVSAVRAGAAPGCEALLLSVSHDNYRAHPGGIQVCVQREEELAAQNGTVYLNLHPALPLPRLAHADTDPDPALMLMLDGASLGCARGSALIEAAGQLAGDFEQVDVVVHQLLGHQPEQIAELSRTAGGGRCWFWLHDYLTLCPSFTLQRNNITYCDAPPKESNACGICLYGPERRDHAARMAHFFETVEVNVLSPSRVTADLWSEKSGLTPASLRVCPHMTLDWISRDKPNPPDDGPITVAYLGTPVPFKGWTIFKSLVEQHNPGEKMRFVYCGAQPVDLTGVDQVPVHVTAETPDAMIDAVASEKIDLVLHWANWPETFSLTCFEALAGGANVLTNRISGNVAAAVETFGRGAVLDDEDDLVAFFEDGRAEAMVTALREVRAAKDISHTLSDMSFSALHDEVQQ